MDVTVTHLVNEIGDFRHQFLVTPKQGDGTTERGTFAGGLEWSVTAPSTLDRTPDDSRYIGAHRRLLPS
jgi:hypothetical protein